MLSNEYIDLPVYMPAERLWLEDLMGRQAKIDGF